MSEHSANLPLTLKEAQALRTALGASTMRYFEDVDRLVAKIDALVADLRKPDAQVR